MLFLFAYCGLAAVALPAGGLERGPILVWPAAGLLVAILLHAPRRQWPEFLILGALGCAGAVLVTGGGPAVAAAAALANILEAWLAARLLMRRKRRESELLREWLADAAAIGAIAPVAAGLVLATLLYRIAGWPWDVQFGRYVFAHALGIMAFFPMFSLLVKPLDELSLYANYIQGLSQGDTPPSTAANAGQALAPYKAEQYEVGAKYELGSFTTTLALFEIKKPNAFLDADNVFRADGEQRNRGIELSLFGELTDDLRVLAGATYIKAEQSKTANPASEGRDAPGVPRRQANLGLSWDTPFVQGLTLDGRWIYTGAAYLDTTNDLKVPHWNRVDVGASYAFQVAGKPLVARANLENLLAKDYWTASNGYMTVSSPRTLSLSLTADF